MAAALTWGNPAVTVTLVVREVLAPASSLTRWGVTSILIRWSSSLMTTSEEAETRPGAEADTEKVSSASGSSSSINRTSKVPEMVRVSAGRVTV